MKPEPPVESRAAVIATSGPSPPRCRAGLNILASGAMLISRFDPRYWMLNLIPVSTHATPASFQVPCSFSSA
jgi:hypothetical protein